MEVMNTIIINKDAYFYLKRLMRVQRGCSKLTPEQEARSWKMARRSAREALADNEIEVCDDSFGGGDGTQNLSKWTHWSVSDLKKMLDEAGYEYRDGEPFRFVRCL